MRQARPDACSRRSSGCVAADHIRNDFRRVEQRLWRQMRMPLPYNQAARAAQLTRI